MKILAKFWTFCISPVYNLVLSLYLVCFPQFLLDYCLYIYIYIYIYILLAHKQSNSEGARLMNQIKKRERERIAWTWRGEGGLRRAEIWLAKLASIGQRVSSIGKTQQRLLHREESTGFTLLLLHLTALNNLVFTTPCLELC